MLFMSGYPSYRQSLGHWVEKSTPQKLKTRKRRDTYNFSSHLQMWELHSRCMSIVTYRNQILRMRKQTIFLKNFKE